VIECPDYSNHGHCADREKGTCQLPHIDRAHTLRKAAKRQGAGGLQDDSDISSGDEAADMDLDDDADDDSDGPEDFTMTVDKNSHEIIQQDDFVSFA
jgi:hypothetical protein